MDFQNILDNRRVVVAMSGGVDSSVAALLLKNQGHNVIGIFLKFWKETTKGIVCENACCNQASLQSARSVAEKLKIPFYVIDISKKFKKDVVDYFIKEYEKGKTPNPCVECNKHIKFGWLIKKAKSLGADHIATGHYAILKQNKQDYKIVLSTDIKKDQTYFLWQLDKTDLPHIMFPIGGFTKMEVRNLARKYKLSVSEKKESQDICFIEDGDTQGFIKRSSKKIFKSGNIVDVSGKVYGQHIGLMNYTIGQRHGLGGIQLFEKNKKSTIFPAYVIKLNIKKNELIIGFEKDLYKDSLSAIKINYLQEKYKLKKEFNCVAKIRYGQHLSICKVINTDTGKAKIIFKTPQRAITPGQSIVFYKKNTLLGGGIIK